MVKQLTRKEMGELIKKQRNSLKLSQSQLAKKANISKMTIIRIENGEISTRPYILNTVLKLLCLDKLEYKIID